MAEDRALTLTTLKEKEDFFARHPWQIEEMLKEQNKGEKHVFKKIRNARI